MLLTPWLSVPSLVTRAIEAKQVKQQEAETAKFEVLRAEHEKDAAVIIAEGEAMAAKLVRSVYPRCIVLFCCWVCASCSLVFVERGRETVRTQPNQNAMQMMQ